MRYPKERKEAVLKKMMTLPANVRKRYGIKNGGAVILEDRENELVLKPAAVVEVEMYTDEQIAAWDEADRLGDQDREKILAQFSECS